MKQVQSLEREILEVSKQIKDTEGKLQTAFAEVVALNASKKATPSEFDEVAYQLWKDA